MKKVHWWFLEQQTRGDAKSNDGAAFESSKAYIVKFTVYYGGVRENLGKNLRSALVSVDWPNKLENRWP